MIHHRSWMSASSAFFTALVAVSLLSTSTVHADDTEVFFPPPDSGLTETVRPNILFIMDTSGSMASTDGTGRTRLDRVKEALKSILDEVSQNTNVGLMRLSDDEGGPVLFPVSHVEAEANEIEALCNVSGPAPDAAGAISQASGLGETAQEGQLTGLTVVDPPVLTAGLLPAISGGGGGGVFRGRSENNRNRSYDDAELRGNNTDFKERELRLGDRTAGLRFPGVTIPRGATVLSAYLEITLNRNHNNSAQYRVSGEATDNSPDFRDFQSIPGRSRTGAMSGQWNVGSNGVQRSPDLSPVIQEIINRPGWNEGNALTLFIEGNGRRRADNNTSGSRRPRLVIEVGTNPRPATGSVVGMRFPELFIPQGVRITSAHVDFQPALISTDIASFLIKGEATDDSTSLLPGFNTLKTRPRTASVPWPGAEVGSWNIIGNLLADVLAPEASRRSPDISAIIQEIVDRPGWCGGNAVSLFLEPALGNLGSRSFYSGDPRPDFAPILSVSYDRDDPQASTGCQQQLSVVQLADPNDDGEERLSNGRVTLNNRNLALGADGNNAQLVALRFPNVQIAQGGQVQEAYVEFTADGTSFGNSSLQISLEGTGDAAPLSSSDDHLSDRADNASPGTVTWIPEEAEEGEAVLQTEDLSGLLQTIVNRGDWAPGNDIVVFIRGTGSRRVYSADGSTAKAPRLRVRSIGDIRGKTVRQRLKELVDDLQNTGFTPLAEVLTEAAHYYRGDEVYFGRTRGSGRAINDGNNGDGNAGNQDDLVSAAQMRISHCASYTGGTQVDPDECSEANLNSSACTQQRIIGSPTYVSPIIDACQSNNIVLLSDGEPNNDTNRGLIRQIAGGNCSSSNCGIDLAGALSTTDQASHIQGNQFVNVYTIGFADLSAQAYLQNVADAGNGTFSPASNAEDLASRFREIIASILDEDTTFVAPAVTINSFNRLTHLDQLYFALFRPQVKVNWNGNLKRFRLQANPGRIVDADGQPAVDPTTGFFLDTARSFWSSVGAEPDGGTVTQGGAEAQFTSVNSRNIYTNVAGNALTAVGNRVNKSNSNITKAILGIDGDTNEAREKILDWARGVDVNDENGDGSRTDMRHTVGDPLHSEPVLVTYGGGDESSDVTVFMGTNEGFIHAFDGRNGQEYFAFIPDELLRNLATLQRNRGTWQGRPYGMDGPLVAVTQGTGVGKSVTLVAGMRRGGRSYYALDVSNREAPRIAWKITGGQTTGFAELGQTWSTPILAKVPYGGATEEVLIFGGGYDANQDARTSPPLSDSMGRAVFMVRASDGQLLWSAGNAAGSVDYPVAEMQASVPATPSVVDLDNDGLADRIYIADTNAKLFRFDIDPLNGGRNNFAAGGMIAHVGGPDAAGNRKFYNAPDVSISISPDTDPILTISIGSGFRAHPLQQGVQDRFFVFFDPDVRPGQTKTFALGPIDDTATELYDATSNLVGSSDPEVAQAAREEMFSRRGAFINLREGEKSLTVSRTFDNRVVFATFQPGRVDGDDACAAGSGTARMYLLNVLGLSAAEDLNESGGDPTTGDRDRELKVRGIPPNPVVLFPDSDDGPIRPIIFVGPESYEPNVEIRAEKTTWEALEPGPLEIEEGGQ